MSELHKVATVTVFRMPERSPFAGGAEGASGGGANGRPQRVPEPHFGKTRNYFDQPLQNRSLVGCSVELLRPT